MRRRVGPGWRDLARRQQGCRRGSYVGRQAGGQRPADGLRRGCPWNMCGQARRRAARAGRSRRGARRGRARGTAERSARARRYGRGAARRVAADGSNYSPQYRHSTATSWICSPQNGQGFMIRGQYRALAAATQHRGDSGPESSLRRGSAYLCCEAQRLCGKLARLVLRRT